MKKTLFTGLIFLVLLIGCSIPEQPDENPPLVVILYPSNGQTVTDTVNINIAAGDDDKVDNVDLYIDDIKVKSWSGQQSTYSYEWNTTLLEENSTHFIAAVAHDKEDNLGHSGNISVTVSSRIQPDGEAPTVNILYPIEGQVFDDTLNILIIAEDNVGIDRVVLYRNGIQEHVFNSAPYSITLDLTATNANSVHTLQAVAFDASDNFTASTAVTITKSAPAADELAPSAAIIYPVNNSNLDASIQIIGEANDNAGIQEVQLFHNGELLLTDTQYPYEFTWDITQYDYDTRHDLFLKAIDINANIGYSTVVTVYRDEITNTPPDVASPIVTIISPVDGDSLAINPTPIVADVIDASAISYVEFYIDGSFENTDTQSPYDYSLDISSYPSGSQHSLFIKAFDEYANVGTAYQVLVIE